jgi:hypothetical protein
MNREHPHCAITTSGGKERTWLTTTPFKQIDLGKFAELGNYKNVATASTIWSRIKRRAMEAGKQAFPDTAASDGAVATPSTPAGKAEPKATPGTAETPTKRKRGSAKGKGKAKAGDGEEADTDGTPVKKQKRTPKKKAVKKEEEEVKPAVEEDAKAAQKEENILPSIEKGHDQTIADDKSGEKSVVEKSVVEKA